MGDFNQNIMFCRRGWIILYRYTDIFHIIILSPLHLTRKVVYIFWTGTKVGKDNCNNNNFRYVIGNPYFMTNTNEMENIIIRQFMYKCHVIIMIWLLIFFFAKINRTWITISRISRIKNFWAWNFRKIFLNSEILYIRH